MAARGEVYVDTSALIALVDRSDTHHALFRRLFASPPALITSPLVIAEGHAWFLRRYDRARALQFLGMIDAMTPLTVLEFGCAEHSGATRVLKRYGDQDLTMADAAGLHLMQARGVASCWSTDHHLGLSGVPLVIRDP